MRWFGEFSLNNFYVMATMEVVQFMTGVADNFFRHVNVGRAFDMSGVVPRIAQDVPPGTARRLASGTATSW